MIRSILISLFLTFSISLCVAQTQKGEFFVRFADKRGTAFQLSDHNSLLSEKALERRSKYGITIDSLDLPTSSIYLDSLRSIGAKIKFQSRWLNGAFLFEVDSLLHQKIATLSFVRSTEKIGINKQPFSPVVSKFDVNSPESTSVVELVEDDFANSWSFVEMINSQKLHNLGYRGEDVLIAVLDAGFNRGQLDRIFDDINSAGRLHSVYDFVEMDDDPWHGSSHGSTVSMFMAANEKGFYIGTAPEATYMLLRTEYVQTETLTEEYNWLAAAEYADSAGADLFNTSLSYLNGFSDTSMNHQFADLNGDKTPITIAADIAASKGIFLVNSAGNNGAGGIGAPADADSTLAIGAVDSDEQIANFSSRGPTSDGRIKPDVVAFGRGVPAFGPSAMAPGNGTSYSGPIVAGASACLLQAFPHVHPFKVMEAIRETANNSLNPNNTYGYGIPDFEMAFRLLAKEHQPQVPSTYPAIGELTLTSNPVVDQLCLLYQLEKGTEYSLEVIAADGKEIYRRRFVESTGFGSLTIEESANWEAGVYVLRLENSKGWIIRKFIKL